MESSGMTIERLWRARVNLITSASFSINKPRKALKMLKQLNGKAN